MINQRERLPVSDVTIESSNRVVAGLRKGAYKEQRLSNAAVPFSEKEAEYLVSFLRTIDSLNFKYIIDCKGEPNETYRK